MPSVVF